jgi:Domain of unknown function (DUF4177)
VAKKRWEYKVVSFDESPLRRDTLGIDLQLEEVLNTHGGDGWELIAQFRHEGELYFEFKRSYK